MALLTHCKTLAFRVKHLTAALLLAIPFVCTVTVFALRRLGGRPIANSTISSDERSAESFICARRIDLMTKIIYGDLREKGVCSPWGEKIYAALIKKWNGFNEDPSPAEEGPQKAKTCKKDFIDTFNEILDSVKRGGFDKALPGVPVGNEDGVALNGAHRISACYVHQKPVKYAVSQKIKHCWDWNYQYWLNLGLDRKYLDAMALKYCEIKKNVYALALFPTARRQDLDEKVNALIKEYGIPVYSKDVSLNAAGGKNFVVTSYYRDQNSSWIGSAQEHYSGAEIHAKGKFPDNPNSPPLQMIFFESNLEFAKIVELKRKIREIYGMDNRSVHITDNAEQTLEMAQEILNSNSLHFLNHRKELYMPVFEGYFKSFKEELARKGIDPNDICVDGSAILAAYGLRDCRDLDFIYHGGDLPNLGNDFDSHNDHIKGYGLNPDDIIYDPRNHFWYQGIKFASLDTLKKLKEARYQHTADLKDANDLQLIASVVK